VPPHLRRAAVSVGPGLVGPMTGASRRGIGRIRWERAPFLPALGRVFTQGRESAFSAAGGSLCRRNRALLVSVSALGASLVQASAGLDPIKILRPPSAYAGCGRGRLREVLGTA
jgi:hypothetical protein